MLTGYSRLTHWQARAVLATAVFVTLFCVGVSMSPLWQGNVGRPKHGDDVALYRAEAERIHKGESYYQAAAAELIARGYPTRKLFNWRTPLPMWFIGKLPQAEWAKFILGALSLWLIIMAFQALAREKGNSFASGLCCVVLLSGPLLFNLLDDLFVMPVLWAGVLIALSICAYGIEKPLLGVVFGLAALFIRDLAFPYCLLCAVISFYQCVPTGDRKNKKLGWPSKELIGWCLGLAGWLIFFGLHWWIVSGLIAPDATAHKHSWIRLGGAGFVLATAQMNAYLILLPPWITALYFAASLIGLAGWNTRLGMRIGLTTCLYVAAFAVVGQDFNQYWGSLIAPLLCFGVVRMPASMRDLWITATLKAYPKGHLSS